MRAETLPNPSEHAASGCRPRRERRARTWCARAAAPALAVAVLALWPAKASAQAGVTFSNASANEGDSMTFTVTLGSRTGVPVPTGSFSVTPDFSGGKATKGTDYTANTGKIDFKGDYGEQHTFEVATTEDAVVEGDETFSVTLTVSGTQENILVGRGTGTIVDDDTATVTIADASASEGDSITFTLTADKAVAGGFTVTPIVTDGTATKGTDYTYAPDERRVPILTFAGTAGETQTFKVATTEDSVVEADETFTVSLSTNTQQDVTVTDTATGKILNDDTATVTVADASAAEGDGITFTVTLDKAVPSGRFYVDPSFTDVTATKNTDYTAYQESLTFAGTAGETQSFTVATTEDAEFEPDETFTVGLTVSGTTATITATDTATGTIRNDDAAPPAVTIADAWASEGDGITFTVTLDKAVSGGLTVTPSFTDGTASGIGDYTPTRLVGQPRTRPVDACRSTPGWSTCRYPAVAAMRSGRAPGAPVTLLPPPVLGFPSTPARSAVRLSEANSVSLEGARHESEVLPYRGY